jgi:membrane protease YdiL (CAAX protease family)
VVRRGLAGSLGRAVLFVVLYVAAVLVVLSLLAGPLTALVGMTGQRVRIDEVLSLAGALLATAVMLRAVDPRSWRDVGLDARSARASLFVGGWCIGGAPLAALHEEVVCRGYLLTTLRDSIGVRGAVVATSVLFGLLHVRNAGSTVESIGIVILAGIFLAAVRVVFDSLYAAWAAHVAWNWIMAVPLHAPVSGLAFEAPDYRTVSTGPAWITGGSWGPEGGLAAALGMVAALIYLNARRRREES